jgi:hypothetical protein
MAQDNAHSTHPRPSLKIQETSSMPLEPLYSITDAVYLSSGLHTTQKKIIEAVNMTHIRQVELQQPHCQFSFTCRRRDLGRLSLHALGLLYFISVQLYSAASNITWFHLFGSRQWKPMSRYQYAYLPPLLWIHTIWMPIAPRRQPQSTNAY